MAISGYYIYIHNPLIYIVYKPYWLVGMDTLSPDRKAARRHRRNLVAKHSKVRAHTHKTGKDYYRKPKYRQDYLQDR